MLRIAYIVERVNGTELELHVSGTAVPNVDDVLTPDPGLVCRVTSVDRPATPRVGADVLVTAQELARAKREPRAAAAGPARYRVFVADDTRAAFTVERAERAQRGTRVSLPDGSSAVVHRVVQEPTARSLGVLLVRRERTDDRAA